MSEPRAGRSSQPEDHADEALNLREIAAAQVREQILEAVLRACGELGYQRTTVEDVYQRYGGYRLEFYNHFANRAECYAIAYEREIERLWRRLMRACEAAGDWRDGLRAALAELAAFVEEDGPLAAGLLVEAHIAPAPIRAKRTEVFERLTRAIDSARRETSASRHSPPPITAAFILSAIEESVVSALARGVPQDFGASVPSLAWLGAYLYFGEGGDA
ncbi:MAG TPA: TetR/AcrR family transcriptional regulator [Solirubrobacterales bacterium]|nr:TetR/AcrR family transcriptional regulator [Solirubrobacterales bacterium]